LKQKEEIMTDRPINDNELLLENTVRDLISIPCGGGGGLELDVSFFFLLEVVGWLVFTLYNVHGDSDAMRGWVLLGFGLVALMLRGSDRSVDWLCFGVAVRWSAVSGHLLPV
jgi:hypothetical protein